MAQRDDRRNLDRLVSDHLSEAWRLATRLTGDPDTAEDVVQEALVRVARGWKSFRGEARFRTWLFRIVINVFRDGCRARLPDKGLVADVCDPRACDPSDAAQAAELERLIASRVSALPPRQREVLVLHGYEGLSTAEIADVLSITPANVHATLHAARSRLKSELAPYLDQASKKPARESTRGR